MRNPKTYGRISSTMDVRTKKGKMVKILFVCKYNAFRSRIAEEYFKKINKNKKIKVISRGIIAEGGPADSEQRKIAKQLLGVDINKRASKTMTLPEIKQADKIIVVANDVPRVVFNYKNNSLQKKVVIWRIKDEQYTNARNIKKIVLRIKKKVEGLNNQLRRK